MSTETFQWVVAIGVGLAALAMVVQAVIVLVMYKTVKTVQDQVTPLIPRAHAVLDSAQSTLTQSKQQIVDVTKKANELMDKVQTMTEETKTQWSAIMTKANEIADRSKTEVDNVMVKVHEIADLSKQQLVKLDGVVTDAADRAKVQMDRAELVIDDTVSRVHESVAVVHNGIMRPVREISGLTQGVRAALGHFLRGGRPAVNQATQDEEMFI